MRRKAGVTAIMLRDLPMNIQDSLTAAAYRSSIPLIAKYLQPQEGDSVLDVGGGTGKVAQLLATTCREVVVLEPERRKIEFGRKMRPNFKFVEGRAEEIPFPDESFDKVLLFLTLHHIQDQGKAIHEIRRVMKKGGRLLLLDLDAQSWIGRLAEFFENNLLHLDCRYFAARELYHLLKAHEFHVMSVEFFTGRCLMVALK
jgi:ubiquinone/menaquinone biosynthesis C-methylase UbiE